MNKRLLFALMAALVTTVLSAIPRADSQQAQPCAGMPTAGKTETQLQMDDCNCEQASAQDKPTYRVGAAPFGHAAKPRVGSSPRVGARRGATRTEPDTLYKGVIVPDLKDRQSPEVVGLLANVLAAREEARRDVEETLAHQRQVLQLAPDNWYANFILKSPKVSRAYDNFIALQNNGSWVSRPKFDWREQGLDVGP